MLPVLGLTLLLPSPPFLMTLVMPNSHRARVAAAPLVNAVDPLGATRRVGVAKVALAVQSELLLMPPLGASPDPAICAPRGTDYKSGRPDSNRRPPGPKPGALPSALRPDVFGSRSAAELQSNGV